MNNFWVFLVALVHLGTSSLCEESSVCKRNQHLREHRDKYNLTYSVHSVQPTAEGISFEITSGKASKLKGTAIFYSNGMFHVYIDEQQPLYSRFRAEVLDFSNTEPISPKAQGQDWTLWVVGNRECTLHYNPFFITCSKSGVAMVQVNSKQLMNFERYRKGGSSREPTAASRQMYTIEDASELLSLIGSDGDESKPRGPCSIGLDFSFASAHHLYGLPGKYFELTNQLEPYHLYNSKSSTKSGGSRGSVPFVLGVSSQRAAGVYWNNPSETWVHVSQQGDDRLTHWISEAGVLEFLIFLEDTPKSVVQKLALATGPPRMPPRFALGIHQFIDGSDQDVYAALGEDFPFDTIWIDQSHQHEYFQWDSERFSDPLSLQHTLQQKRKRILTRINPFRPDANEFKLSKKCGEPGGKQQSPQQAGYVQDYAGYDIRNEEWSTYFSVLDVVDSATRNWWQDQFAYAVNYQSSPVNHAWTDMNEPTLFNIPGNTLPKNSTHSIYEHRELHNIFSYYAQMSIYNGLDYRDDYSQRSLVATSSFFAGTQRYGPIWLSNSSLPTLLSMSISGLSFVGTDGVHDPVLRLLLPLSVVNRPDLAQVRKAAELHYALLPMYYSASYEYSQRGTPLISPLFLEFPQDISAYSVQNEFILGKHLLVVSPNTTPYFPKARWYDFYSYTEVTTPEPKQNEARIFIKGGSVIVLQQVPRPSSSEMSDDPYTIIVALDEALVASGLLYIDDGETGIENNAEAVSYAELKFWTNIFRFGLVMAGSHKNPVDKIVVLGLTEFPSVVLSEGPAGYTRLTHEVSNQALIIHKPNYDTSTPWTIYLRDRL